MSRQGKMTDEERISAVQEYQDGKGSFKTIGDKYGVTAYTIRNLVNRAKAGGIEFVKRSRTNKKYSAETKIKAVEEYLSGKSSQFEVCKKYKITSRILLQNWISCYNNGKDFKERTRSERGITMKTGRKTTQEERIEIVAFCIENGKDYGLTMEKYGVSYKQIYSWVRKYEARGVEGLTDRRGKSKPENELTEADRLRIENKILQARIKDQEMEIKLLKNSRS